MFVCVRLAAPEIDLQGRAARLFERSPREVWRALRERLPGARGGSLDPDRLAGIVERARVATERVKSCLDAEPARADEVQWLIRRAFCRSLGEPTHCGAGCAAGALLPRRRASGDRAGGGERVAVAG